jgi:predicted dehydrogenase
MAVAPVNIGLIGFGRIAELVHLRTLMSLPQVHVAAIAEADANRRRQMWQRSPQSGGFADYHDLLREADVQAVVICLPPALHAPAAIAAFEAGKHVYLEKPITPSLEEAKAVCVAWRESGRIGMMGFNFRFHPLYQRAKAVIESGQYGALVGARSVFTTPTRQLPLWKQQRGTGGGVLLDLASHHIDVIHDLFGQQVTGVSAFEHSQRVEADNATLHLRLESGALVQSFFSMNSVSEHRFEFYFEKAKVIADLAAPHALDIYKATTYVSRRQRLKRGLLALAPRTLASAPGYEPSFARSLGAFAEAVRSGSAVHPDMNDGYRCLQVVVAAEEAARSGRHVELAPNSVVAETQFA